jgi:hypothetical protein
MTIPTPEPRGGRRRKETIIAAIDLLGRRADAQLRQRLGLYRTRLKTPVN